jgi:hypothetical protein
MPAGSCGLSRFPSGLCTLPPPCVPPMNLTWHRLTASQQVPQSFIKPLRGGLDRSNRPAPEPSLRIVQSSVVNCCLQPQQPQLSLLPSVPFALPPRRAAQPQLSKVHTANVRPVIKERLKSDLCVY